MASFGREVVILDAARSAIGRRGGALSTVHPVDLSAGVLNGLLSRTGLDPDRVDDVVWGCVNQVGEQASNVARLAVLAAGWPESVPGTTVDRACGSSQQAIHFAAAAVASGQYDIVIAGGVESMTRVPMGSARRAGPGLPYGPSLRRRYPERLADQGEFSQGLGAEMLARQWQLDRRQLDDYSLLSHDRAAAAIDDGLFDAEIIQIQASDGASTRTVHVDEGVRRDTSADALAALKTPFDPDGVVTAGNSSQISDGAAAVLIADKDTARSLGIRPMARFVSFALTGVDPISMLTGPIPATRRALATAGLTCSDVGVFEVNEAFASVVCAWQAETGVGIESLNPNGGAIALGHPLGASGARLMTTMLHHMRTVGVRFGLETMCEAGGMANATIVERL